MWGPRGLPHNKDVRRSPLPPLAQRASDRPFASIPAGVRKLPSAQRARILDRDRPVRVVTAQSAQASPRQVRRALYGSSIRWLGVVLLAAIVFASLLRPSPLSYLVVPLGLPFAFLSPSNALATYILTVLVPCAFGENNIAARFPVLLLVPMAYHAFMYFKARRPGPQRVFLLLQGLLCGLMVLLALASESLSEINESIHVYVGPIALLLAAIPLWTMSDRRFLFKVFALAGTMVAVKTILRFASHDQATKLEAASFNPDALRGILDQLDPNYMACYIGFGLICALCLLIEAVSSKQNRWMMVALLLPISLSLVAMGQLASRGMALALLAGLAVLVGTARMKLSSRLTVLGLVLIAGLGVAVSGGFDLLWTRFQGEDLKTGAGRKDINRVAVLVFADRPWSARLLGGGSNSLTRALGVHTHNAFTEQLLDHGILGASCFVGLFVCLGVACARTRGPLRASGLALLGYTAVAGLSVSPFRYAWGWIALACILPCWERAHPIAVPGVWSPSSAATCGGSVDAAVRRGSPQATARSVQT